MVIYLNLSENRDPNAQEEFFTQSDVEDLILDLRYQLAEAKRELAIYKPSA